MPTTLTDGVTTLTPTLNLTEGYNLSRESANQLHWILGDPSPAVTLRPAKLRTGTLKLRFVTESSADAAVAMHARPAIFTLTDTDLPLSSMRYVLDGTVARDLDPEAFVWIVSVDYQEIT